MELSPSSVALTFNLWPLNIYQLLNWLCTIIPSSISQIHHFDLSSQFQVTCTIPTDAVILSQKLELKPCCSTMSSVRKSQKHLSLEATCGRRGVGCQSSWQCDEAGLSGHGPMFWLLWTLSLCGDVLESVASLTHSHERNTLGTIFVHLLVWNQLYFDLLYALGSIIF